MAEMFKSTLQEVQVAPAAPVAGAAMEPSKTASPQPLESAPAAAPAPETPAEAAEAETHTPSEDAPETLKVAAWNTGAGAKSYPRSTPKGHPDAKQYKELRDPKAAAAYMRSTGHHVVICPESDTRCEEEFAAQSYDCMRSGWGKRIFYDKKVLTLQEKPKQKGKDLPAVPKIRSGHAHSAMFRMERDGTSVLITAVHCGHYGEPSNPDQEAAYRDLETLRGLQQEMGAATADRVIVGGDFNELGQLIWNSHNKKHNMNDNRSWVPLPSDVKNVSGTYDVGKTLFDARYNGMFDHLWVGGHRVGSKPTAKMNRNFGSDHNAISVWGV